MLTTTSAGESAPISLLDGVPQQLIGRSGRRVRFRAAPPPGESVVISARVLGKPDAHGDALRANGAVFELSACSGDSANCVNEAGVGVSVPLGETTGTLVLTPGVEASNPPHTPAP